MVGSTLLPALEDTDNAYYGDNKSEELSAWTIIVFTEYYEKYACYYQEYE